MAEEEEWLDMTYVVNHSYPEDLDEEDEARAEIDDFSSGEEE